MKRIICLCMAAVLLLTGGTMTSYAKEQLGTPESDYFYWEGDTAHWDAVEHAVAYNVYLYHGNTFCKKATIKKEKYNFASHMTERGNYKFQVRALGGADYEESRYSGYSESRSVSRQEEAERTAEKMKNVAGTLDGKTGKEGGPGTSSAFLSDGGAWVQDSMGWWYRNTDGSYPKSVWLKLNETWYYFEGTGYMKTGWLDWNRQRYYCQADGAMVTGTHEIEGVAYTFNESGILQK